MDEYIEKEAALAIAAEWCPDDDGSVGKTGDLREMLDEIESIPAVDVRIKARWVWPGNRRERPYCSECLNDAFWVEDYGFTTEDFCPFCGAYMKEYGDG